MQSVFEYLDYRDYLRDFYELRKFESSLSTYRMLADFFGMDTANMFRILKGQAHLPVRSHSRAIEFLGLSGKEAEFFLLLISHSRERNVGMRKELLEKAMALREGGKAAKSGTSNETVGFDAENAEKSPRMQREVSTLTFAGDLETLNDIQEILLRCRSQIQRRIETTAHPDRMLQLEMSIFPISQLLDVQSNMDTPALRLQRVSAQGT
ncbi:MAG: TIGR02147 family protein [Fibrobacterota bacterium]|nr:MAG: TIGR02147 family protein [Fibrobacterota bacterium]